MRRRNFFYLFTLAVRGTWAIDAENSTTAAGELWVPLTNLRDLCEEGESYSKAAYTFNTDQINPDASGFQCMEVGDAPDRYNNETAFSVTWSWSESPDTLHSYPHARLESPLLPTQLSNLTTLWLYTVWAYTVGNDTASSTDTAGIVNADMKAYVAMDVFLDTDANRSTSVDEAAVEMMVWLAAYGGVTPIGYDAEKAVKEVTDIGGANFKLYSGTDNGKTVYTWLADRNMTTIYSDVSELAHSLPIKNIENYWLGVMRFGTGTYHTKPNTSVTFGTQVMQLQIVQGVPTSGAGREQVRWLLLAGALVMGIMGVW